MGIQITPSILSADFAALGAEIARIPSSDWIHVDVMDNHFVPNLTLGPTMIEALVRSTTVPVDAHLMITDADRNAAAYVEAWKRVRRVVRGAGAGPYGAGALTGVAALRAAAALTPRTRRADGADIAEGCDYAGADRNNCGLRIADRGFV